MTNLNKNEGLQIKFDDNLEYQQLLQTFRLNKKYLPSNENYTFEDEIKKQDFFEKGEK